MKDKLYDGKTAVPFQGNLVSEEDKIIFLSDQKTVSFQYSDILNLDPVGREFRLEIRNPENPTHSFIIVFYSKESYTSILLGRKSLRKLPFLDLWQNANFGVKIGALILTAILAFSVYNTGLSYAYFFVPTSYDKKQSQVMSGWVRDYFSECSSPSLKSTLKKIGKKLKDEDDPFDYDIIVIDDDVFNAFAMPGGTIVVFTELLKKTETPEELAGVLAHEMAHIHKRHGVRRQIRSAGNVVLLSLGIGSGFEGVDMLENMDSLYEVLSVTIYDQKFSREYESEADEIALEKLKKSNLTGEGFLNFFKRIQEEYEVPVEGEEEKDTVNVPDFLSSHPATQERIEYVKNIISHPDYPKGKLGISNKEWNRIRGLCSPIKPKKEFKNPLEL
ncbi:MULTISPECIES: M48 family metallopeptidase [unclassified Leptospira]|uniref:M48 family metallopeptidase n=1 Tax=unclassified Leptospira TaxID=2633828 RepID=UPI0002BDFD69|nr:MULTISPECIES: M48 family metallopeptidase [unclassified Leptospira]EMK00539.1 peptidase, M48 family [Leptospira sp. B5-022]MCR1793065.1 M48 family metallopeptidase [Leptospira sp. id769339]